MKITLLCPICGTIRTPSEEDDSFNICDYCGSERIKIDCDPSDLTRGTLKDRPYNEEKIYRKFLYNNLKFNENIFEERIRKEREEEEDFDKVLNDFIPTNTPHCPICNSTNLSKITATKKVAKIAMFGIFGMGDNGKTWKCNNCGSKF